MKQDDSSNTKKANGGQQKMFPKVHETVLCEEIAKSRVEAESETRELLFFIFFVSFFARSFPLLSRCVNSVSFHDSFAPQLI